MAQVYDGKPWSVDDGGIITLICCDCGLHHHMKVDIDEDQNQVVFTVNRDNKKTSGHRRSKKSGMQQTEYKGVWKLVHKKDLEERDGGRSGGKH